MNEFVQSVLEKKTFWMQYLILQIIIIVTYLSGLLIETLLNVPLPDSEFKLNMIRLEYVMPIAYCDYLITGDMRIR